MKTLVAIIIFVSMSCVLYLLPRTPIFDKKIVAMISEYQADNDLHSSEVSRIYKYSHNSITRPIIIPQSIKKSLRKSENKILHMQPNSYIIKSLKKYETYLIRSRYKRYRRR